MPGRLDWNRYRGTIEQVASAELGLPVRIEGPVGLSLLPEPVLTAQRVVIAAAERTALRVRALRLRVGLAPLLAGRIAPRELVLSEPELRLPWPLPDPFRLRAPDWLGPFAARIEQGRLVVGRMEFTGIDATLGGAETGALSLAGTGQVTRLAWHFTARLTATGADGAQGLDIALDGEGRGSGLGGTFSGQIAPDGSVVGRIAGRGPDLSLLVPAPAVPFRGEGRLTASGGLAAADDLALEIGGSPVRGAVALRVAPTERLDVALAASRLDLDQWLPALRGGNERLIPWTVPVGLDLSAEAAGLWGGTVRRLRAAFDVTGGAVGLREATALLPGDAELSASGRLTNAGAASGFEGHVSLAAPDMRATLRWLAQAVGPADLAALPPEALRAASLSGTVIAGNGRVALTDIAGRLDGSPVAGSLAIQSGERRRTDADLWFDHLDLDPWLPAQPPEPAGLSGRFTGTLRIHAAHATARGLGITAFALDAASADRVLTVSDLEGVAQGVRLALSGTLGAKGKIADGKLSLSGADASPLARLLPTSWRDTSRLWHGPVALEAAAAGPPEALALRLGLDLADARLEAQPIVDLTNGSWSGPATLRHPGAKRLFAASGLLAEWLGEGSLALAGQFSGGPGRLSADNFDLTAGLLRTAGQLTLDWSGAAPQLTGRVTAEALPVPPTPLAGAAPLDLAALRGWGATLRVEAARVLAWPATAPDHPMLEQAEGTVALRDGVLRIDPFTARRGAATLQGTATVDATGDTPVLAVTGALSGLDIAAPLTGWPVDIAAGHGEAVLRLKGEGHGISALIATAAGTVHVTLADGALAGLDLPAVRAALTGAGAADAPGDAEARVRSALAGGSTRFASLRLDAAVAHGTVSLDGNLTGQAGALSLAGTVSIPALTTDLRATLHPDPGPDVTDPPDIGLRLSGPADAPRRSPELAALVRWLADHPAR